MYTEVHREAIAGFLDFRVGGPCRGVDLLGGHKTMAFLKVGGTHKKFKNHCIKVKQCLFNDKDK